MYQVTRPWNLLFIARYIARAFGDGSTEDGPCDSLDNYATAPAGAMRR